MPAGPGYHPAMSDADLVPEGCHLVGEGGERFLNLGSSPAGDPGDAAERLRGYGERFRQAFAEEAEACGVLGVLQGDALALEARFEGQENANGDQILQAFADELRAGGVLVGSRLVPHPAMEDGAADEGEEALRHAVRRLRTLLNEHNSYLSGGLRYPFPDPIPGVAERGLAIYRFPARAEVDVEAEGEAIRIRFAAADLGEVTSSGFYLPTLFHGDFVVEADYELPTFRAAPPEPACFALFAQNESSTHRYYAQRMADAGGPHRVLATVVDVTSPERVVEGLVGSFRIRRDGERMTLFHRSPGEEWASLGEAQAPAESEMLVGAKIWAKVRCEGLEALVSRLRVDGYLAERQVPPMPIRPDPRREA